MKKSSIRRFLCQIRNLTLRKHYFFKVSYNKINKFLALFLTKQGFFRGFFLVRGSGLRETKICIILKYDEREKSSFSFLKRQNILLKNSQFSKKSALTKYCNGLGVVLLYSIKGFILNDDAFWSKLGAKKVFELK